MTDVSDHDDGDFWVNYTKPSLTYQGLGLLLLYVHAPYC